VGFETGKGNAYITPLRDKTRGRIYRIVYGEAKPVPPKRLDSATPEQLVAALADDNLFWRLTAQRLLVESSGNVIDIRTRLDRLLTDTDVDAVGSNAGALHALWVLHHVNQISDRVARLALKHPAAAVRKAGLQTLSQPSIVLESGVLSDPDAQVRLAAMLALARLGGDGEALVQAMRRPENARDRWIPDAAIAAAASCELDFLPAALAAARAPKPADAPAGAGAANLVPNGSFEETDGDMPVAWELNNWQGSAEASVDNAGPAAGERCLRLTATGDDGADSSVGVVLDVRPNTNYRLSARVRTRDVRKGSGRGALLNVHEFQSPARVATGAVTGTTDWTRVQASFNSGKFERITVNCLLGGWGRSQGTAWFDDVRLEAAGESTGVTETMLRVVATHYAQRGPADSVLTMLRHVRGVDDATAQAVLDGLLAGWPDGVSALPGDAESDQALRDLSASLSPDNRARLVTLAQRLGRGALFAEETAAAQRELIAAVADAGLEPPARLDAARRLLGLADTAGNIEAILKQVTPQAPPALAAGLTTTVAASRQDTTGAAVLKRWKFLPPSARKAAVDVLMRRAPWHAALLDALEHGGIARSDLSAEQAQQLVAVAPNADAAKRAKTLLAATGRVPDANRQKVIDKLLPLADRKGDAAAGKASFEKNCAVCHAFAGAGGRVGPDLTGTGTNPRREILLNIIDPNRSVEGNYQLWIVQTTGGETVSGRLDTESQTTLELLDAAGKPQVIQRKDIKRMASTPTSIMPEGFELLPERELTDLIEYLAQPVEAQPVKAPK
jgi:putative heme-binding domain-containing protein